MERRVTKFQNNRKKIKTTWDSQKNFSKFSSFPKNGKKDKKFQKVGKEKQPKEMYLFIYKMNLNFLKMEREVNKFQTTKKRHNLRIFQKKLRFLKDFTSIF